MTGPTAAASQILHASCVAVQGRGLLITGPSGVGKSGLALQLMALGAELVADDRCEITVEAGQLTVRPPLALRGLIEARGIGILNAPPLDVATVALVVDLAQTETQRLPPVRQITLLGVACNLVHGLQSSHFPAALMCYLLYGRYA